MGLVERRLESIRRQMRVDLRRGERRVPQKLLDAAEIGSSVEQFGSKGMPHGVRRDSRRQSCGAGKAIETSSERGGIHGFAAIGNKQSVGLVCSAVFAARGKELGPRCFKVGFDCLQCAAIEGDDPLLRPFSEETRGGLPYVDIMHLELGQL